MNFFPYICIIMARKHTYVKTSEKSDFLKENKLRVIDSAPRGTKISDIRRVWGENAQVIQVGSVLLRVGPKSEINRKVKIKK